MSNRRRPRPPEPGVYRLPYAVAQNLHRLPDEFLGFHVVMGTWSAANNTDGYIPGEVGDLLDAGWSREARAAVGAFARRCPTHGWTLAALGEIAAATGP